MIKILFVCHGNICRSPMAEFVMKKMISELLNTNINKQKNSLSETIFEIASAATSTEEIENPVYPEVKRILNAHGIDCSHKRARQMTFQDYEYYDYIVLMDKNNLHNLRYILPQNIYEKETSKNFCLQKKVSLLMDWTGLSKDVRDPWYTGDFESTWKDIYEGCKALLDSIIKKNKKF